jgi:hypothetical protein
MREAVIYNGVSKTLSRASSRALALQDRSQEPRVLARWARILLVARQERGRGDAMAKLPKSIRTGQRFPGANIPPGAKLEPAALSVSPAIRWCHQQ